MANEYTVNVKVDDVEYVVGITDNPGNSVVSYRTIDSDRLAYFAKGDEPELFAAMTEAKDSSRGDAEPNQDIQTLFQNALNKHKQERNELFGDMSEMEVGHAPPPPPPKGPSPRQRAAMQREADKRKTNSLDDEGGVSEHDNILPQEQRRELGDIPTDLNVIVYEAIGDNPRKYEVDIPNFGKHEGELSADVDADNIEDLRNFVIADLKAQYTDENTDEKQFKTAATKIQAAFRSKQARNQTESQKHMDLTSLDMREIGKAKVFEGKMAKLGEEIGKLNPGVKGSYYEQTKHVASLIVQRPFAKKYSDIFKQNESIQAKIKEALKTDYIVVDFTDPKGEKTKTVKFENLAAHMRDHAAHLKSKNPLWESSTTEETGNLSELIPELEKSAKKYQKWIDTAKDPRSSTAKIVDRTISVARMAVLGGALAAFVALGPVAPIIALGALGVAGGAGLLAAGFAGGASSILALTGYGVAALAVMRFGVWLYKRNEAAVDKFFSDSKEAIGNKASAAWEGTKNTFGPVITAMGDAASSAKKMIKSKYQHEMLHHSMYKPNKEAQLKLSEQELNDLNNAIVRANVAVYASANPDDENNSMNEAITMDALNLLNDHRSEYDMKKTKDDMKKSGAQLRKDYGLYYDNEVYSSSEGPDKKYPALHGKGELDADQANPRTLHGMVLLVEELRTAEDVLEDRLIEIGESKESSLSQAAYDAIKPLLKSVRRQRALLDTSISVEKANQSKEEWKALVTSAKDAVFGVKLEEAKTRLDAAQDKLKSLRKDLSESEGEGYQFIADEIVAADKLVRKLQTQRDDMLAKQEEMKARLEAKANAPSYLQSVKAYFSRGDAKRRSTAFSVGQEERVNFDEIDPLVSRGGPSIDDTDDTASEITEDGLMYDEDRPKGVMGSLKSNVFKHRLREEVGSREPDQPEESLENRLKKAQDELEDAQDAVDNPREGVDPVVAQKLAKDAEDKVAELINEISPESKPPSQ
ncbi:MAG: hypothetical protein P1U39_09000 [Legionellaceae bacterium]|nr:hypothetical protein [Legionellaceae bacterium]